jgi:DNA-binding GntR family transcriptional regulator
LPGAVVTEAYLSELLGCGRTPLREATQRLAQEGFMVVMPRRGLFVAELSIIGLGNLIETLGGVQAFAVRQAAERIGPLELARLDEILCAAEQAGKEKDFLTWVELDFEFHCVIAEATQNPYTIDALRKLNRLMSRFAYLGLKRAQTAEGALEDHRLIVEALKAHDPDESRQRMERHVEHGRERMRAAF